MALPEVGVKAVVKDSKKFLGTLGKMGGAVSGFGKTALKIGAVGIGALGAAAGLAGGAMIKLAMDAAPLEGIGKAFDGLTADMEGGSKKMLNALKEGSQGMITNRDLMEGFNKAAQLVSKDFAQTLPDAMGYLGKVSAATGQDMGFMLDSLTTGVGRLSPMILDNLGIQVSLTEANEAYAASIGKTVGDLTKQEQQTALMAQVMEKLATNTADMPEITDNAATKMAQFNVAMKNAKDQIGKALLPVLTKLMGIFTKLVTKYGPKVTKFIEKFASVIQTLGKYFAFVLDEGDSLNDFLVDLPEPLRRITQFFGDLIVGVQDLIQQFQWGGWDRIFTTFEDGSSAIGGFLKELGLGEEVADRVGAAINSVVGFIRDELIPTIISAIEPITNWVKDNVKLKDVLIALAIVLGGVVLSAIVGVVTALAPLILIPAAIIVAVTLLRKAWETNWNGIRDKAAAVVEWVKNNLVPWFQEKIPQAFEAVKRFWENTLKPALEALRRFIEDPVIPVLKKIVEWLKDKITEAMDTVKAFWENTLKPALTALWEFIQDTLIPIIEDVVGWLGTNIPRAISAIEDAWNNVLKPVLTAIWEFIRDKVIPIIETAVAWIKEKTPEAFRAVISVWNNQLRPTLEAIYNVFLKIRDSVQWVIDKVIALIDWLSRIPSIPNPFGGLSVGGGGSSGGDDGIVTPPPQIGSSAFGGGVTIQMTNNIYNDMDMAVFESRVLQVVTDGMGA